MAGAAQSSCALAVRGAVAGIDLRRAAAESKLFLEEDLAMSFDSELARRNLVHYAPLVPFPEVRRLGSGPVHYVRPGIFYLTTQPGAPANQYLEVGETGGAGVGQDMPFNALQYYPAEVSWLWDVESEWGIPTDDAWCAVQWGTAAAAMPYPAAPARPIIQLRWRANPPSLVLYVARGDGVTPATAIVSNVGPAAGYRFRIVSVPGVKAEAWAEDELVARVTDPALLPDFLRLYPTVETPGLCRLGITLWTGPGFGGPAGMTSWMGPLNLTFLTS